MYNATAIATVFYQDGLKFLSDYVRGLLCQTYSDFTLVAFNDGVKDLETILKNSGVANVLAIDVDGSLSEIRGKLISYLADSHFSNIVFLDMDDFPSDNRVQDALINLEDHAITFSDFNLINSEGKLLEEKIWGNRLAGREIIKKADLQNYNVLGLGNCAMRKSLLKKIEIKKDVKIPDWHIFYSLIDNHSASFSSRSFIFYRQHRNNLAGLKKTSEKRLQYIFEAKENHYFHLKERHPELTVCYESIILLKKHFASDQALKEGVRKLTEVNYNLFWWEETEILKNENTTYSEKKGI